jgi:hypothetical protein
MTPRSYTRYVLLLAAVASACPADGQVQTPAEVRALPPWAGEEAAARSLPPHYVFRDANGQIVVSYPHPDNPGRRITYRFWLPNRVDPHIGASVAKREESGQSIFTYTYKLRNGASAASAILQWSVVGPANQELTVGHPIWKSYNARVPVAPQALLPDAPVGAFEVWSAVDVPQLSAGTELGDFTLHSRFSPGLTTAYASGEGVLEEPEGEFPEAVIQELIPLQRPHVWQRPVVTIGPRFAPGAPLPAILEGFRKDVASLIKQGLLSSESSYVQELQGVLGGTGSTVPAVLRRKASPQSPIEKDLDSALRMSAIATQ